MTKNVLIATLGESPIVVTSIVTALQAKEEMTIEQLHVIYPQGENLIGLGYDMVKEHFDGQCHVSPCTLKFSDTNSRETSMEFLQILSGLIENHETAGDNVYLSLAGGRKNMSALMAVTCQFFKIVRGLYHILDQHENDLSKRNFHSIEKLFLFGEAERKKKLSPPAEDLILVKVPYQHLSNSIALRKYFSETQTSLNAPTPIEIEGELDAFYSEIFQKQKTAPLLDVYLSKVACEQFREECGSNTQKLLMNCFRSMRYSQLLESRGKSLKNAKTDCTPFKMGNTAERPFYYRTNGEVLVCEIALKNTTYEDIANGNRPVWSKDHDKYVIVSELEEDSILIAPLGKSPMVVTQTFTLLSEREGVNIKKIVIVHPKNAEIRTGVNILKKAFKKIGEDQNFFISSQIENIQDIESSNDCKTYLEELVFVISKEQEKNPDKSIYLSLSGGRKGMTALTLFAAQQANIDAVYHTLITDIDLENKIEEETTIDKLKKLTDKKKNQRLFLDAYDKSKFELFRVPVIPIK